MALDLRPEAKSWSVLQFNKTAPREEWIKAKNYVEYGLLTHMGEVRDACKAEFMANTPEENVAMVQFIFWNFRAQDLRNAALVLMHRDHAEKLRDLSNDRDGKSEEQINEIIRSTVMDYRAPKAALHAVATKPKEPGQNK